MKADQNKAKLQIETPGNFKSQLESNGFVHSRRLQDNTSIAINNTSIPRLEIQKSWVGTTLSMNLRCNELSFIDCYIETLELAIELCPILSFEGCTIGRLVIHKLQNHNISTIVVKRLEEGSAIDTSNIGSLVIQGPHVNLSIHNTELYAITAIESISELNLSLHSCKITNDDPASIRVIGNGSLKFMDETIATGGCDWVAGQGTLLVASSTVNGPISLIQSFGRISVNLIAATLHKLNVENSILVEMDLYLKGGSVKNINCKLVEFNELWLGSKPNIKAKVDTLTLVDCEISKGRWLEIDNCPIRTIELRYFRNFGSFAIMNTEIHEAIIIDHSDLGESLFQNIVLNENLRFELSNSSIIEMKFYTIGWMHDYQLFETTFSSQVAKDVQLQYFLSLKESYRQLKAISLSALNTFDALRFQYHEQRIQKQILKLKNETWDYLLLATNETFNNYGLSYTLPFKWLIGVHAFWFIIQVAIGSTFDYGLWIYPNQINWSLTLKACSEFIYTLFPLHSSDYLKGQTGWPLIIDILMRLTSGYFIYYFLSATRKFHLK